MLLGAQVHAQQPTVEITDTILNRLLGSLGALSAAGVSQPYNIARTNPAYEICIPMGKIVCPDLDLPPAPGLGSNEIPLLACKKFGGGYDTLPVGQPVAWRWWVSRPKVVFAANSMKFTATVTTRVGGEWREQTKTVDAALVYDASSNSLKLAVSPFSVPLEIQNSSANLGEPPVNVAALYSIMLPLEAQPFEIPLPTGSTRHITGRITGANTAYLPGAARITLNVAL
jgi:hypothetical protein